MDVIGYMDVIDSCFKGYFMKSNRLLEMVLKLAKEPELRFFCNRNLPTSTREVGQDRNLLKLYNKKEPNNPNLQSKVGD